MSVPTAEWERLGDRFYRKIPLYQDVFDQDLELENYIVVGAPLSGAVGEICQVSNANRLTNEGQQSIVMIRNCKLYEHLPLGKLESASTVVQENS